MKPLRTIDSDCSNTPLMALPKPSDGIELLVDMARDGRIDPWNVDLVTVADEYLKVVNQQGAEVQAVEEPLKVSPDNQERTQRQATEGQTRLRLTGKTLWYLAILLRMKSDLLSGSDPFGFDDEIEDADFGDLQEFDEDGEPIDSQALSTMSAAAADRFKQALRKRYGTLESVLQRRTSAKQPRIRPVTLDDLIRELKKFEALEQERSARAKVSTADKRRIRDFSKLSTEDIRQKLAHDEFQESHVSEVKAVLDEHLPAEEEASMSLTDLVDVSGLSRVVCFLSLLFLEARHEIEVQQEQFYSDELTIHWPNEPTIVSETN